MNETEPLPQNPDDIPAPAAPAPAAAEQPRRGILRPVIIGAAAGLAVLALGIGGAVIADMIDQDETVTVASRDDSPSPVPTDSAAVPTPSPTHSNDGRHDGNDDGRHGGDDDAPITTAEYNAVAAAALTAAGGSGTIEELKRDDDGAAWEVDVRLDNGAKVEVELAADLSVISTRIDD